MKHNYTLTTQQGNWKVIISPSTNYGYFYFNPPNVPKGEMFDVPDIEGGLWFKHKELTEFDGVFDLPANVVKAIYDLGYTVTNDQIATPATNNP